MNLSVAAYDRRPASLGIRAANLGNPVRAAR